MQPANVPDLTARQLHAVLAVAEHNSFIAAAAFLKTSQPALTRTIKRVEDVLGVRLFDRSTRRVAITAAGKEFVAVAERMLNDLRISISSMREIGEESGIPSYLVADGRDVKEEWFDGKTTVGLTAGASAPEVLVDDVISTLRRLASLEVSALSGMEERVYFRLPRALVDA